MVVRNRGAIACAVAVVVVVAAISATARERQRITRVEELVVEVLAPLQEVGYRGVGLIQDTAARLAVLQEIEHENRRLRDELTRYVGLEGQLEELRRENARLRDLVAFVETVSLPVVAAEVIARNPDNWFSVILLNKGRKAGLDRDMTVITSRGLVGRIIRVTSGTAAVLLISDPDSGVGAMVQRSRDAGILLGSAGGQTLELKLFSREADVVTGDRIVTSGLGMLFPKGLEVGTVTGIRFGDHGLVKYAEVRPAVDLSRLETVLVIMSSRRETEALLDKALQEEEPEEAGR